MGTNYHSVFPKMNKRWNILYKTTCVLKAPLKWDLITFKTGSEFLDGCGVWGFGTRHLTTIVIPDKSNKRKTG
jgi:hypothetical protein